ncbi:MAG: hypothetical protein U0270_01725 [Labilithrix sp.]
MGDAEPLVERVLPSMPAIPVQMWLVSHRELYTSRRVRVVFDLLLEHLGPATRVAKKSAKKAAKSSRRRR